MGQGKSDEHAPYEDFFLKNAPKTVPKFCGGGGEFWFPRWGSLSNCLLASPVSRVDSSQPPGIGEAEEPVVVHIAVAGGLGRSRSSLRGLLPISSTSLQRRIISDPFGFLPPSRWHQRSRISPEVYVEVLLRIKGCSRSCSRWWGLELPYAAIEDDAVLGSWRESGRIISNIWLPPSVTAAPEKENIAGGGMASRGRLGVPARESEQRRDEPRREDQGEQQAPAPQGPGLVQAMQTQAHTQAALQAQLEAQALSAACQKEGEMEQYLEVTKASQKRPAAPFQRQDRKKATFQSPQRPVASGSSQVPSQRSPSGQKECRHCGRAHGGTECWKLAGKCLKCGSSEHRIKDCPRLQQG
ncbi:hypothetical protein Taro_052316, partial [Colocasia esculenta]|nr:hypothetical protein [Colocasia esculenta]